MILGINESAIRNRNGRRIYMIDRLIRFAVSQLCSICNDLNLYPGRNLNLISSFPRASYRCMEDDEFDVACDNLRRPRMD